MLSEEQVKFLLHMIETGYQDSKEKQRANEFKVWKQIRDTVKQMEGSNEQG